MVAGFSRVRLWTTSKFVSGHGFSRVHRPQTICHSDRNRISRFLNDSGGHVEERPFMSVLSGVEGPRSEDRTIQASFSLSATRCYPSKTTKSGPARQDLGLFLDALKPRS